MFVANGEPPVLSALGAHWSKCDEQGVDFIALGEMGLIGIQRKEVQDLVSSLRDGRVFDFLTRSTELAAVILIVEGDWEWDRRGESRRCRGFTWAQWTGLRLSFMRKHGVLVIETPSIEQTAVTLVQMEEWFKSESKVSSLLSVPKQQPCGDKKKASALRVLMCVEGVLINKADLIYEGCGGLPVALTKTAEELQQIKGIGPVIARKMEETFNGTSNGASR